MTWEYGLIGLAAGIIIGALAMRFGISKLHQQKSSHDKLDTGKKDLEAYRQELAKHFAYSTELLDNLAKDYHQLYQHMIQSSSDLLPGRPVQENPFNYRLTGADNDYTSVGEPPRDYSDKASGLLHSKASK